MWAGMEVCDENGTGMLAARKAFSNFLIDVLVVSLPSTPLPIFAPPMTPGTCHRTPST